MKDIFLTIRRYALAFVLIYLCLFLGRFIATQLPLSIPSSIVGLCVLFLLLSVRIIPATWVEPGASLLMRHLILLFVPVSVGIVDHFATVRDHWIAIVVSCAVSTLVVFVVVALIAHYFYRNEAIGEEKDI